MKKLLSDQLLSFLPIRFRLLSRTDLSEPEAKKVNSRYIKSLFYRNNALPCRPNFRKTSKLRK